MGVDLALVPRPEARAERTLDRVTGVTTALGDGTNSVLLFKCVARRQRAEPCAGTRERVAAGREHVRSELSFHVVLSDRRRAAVGGLHVPRTPGVSDRLL